MVTGCSVSQLLHWPLIEQSIVDSVPAIIMIAFTVGHSSVSEMLFRTTIGKSLLGCSVLSTNGSRARPGQILLRNVMKFVALVVLPLGLFVFMNPYRQRLGDLAARTVVVVSNKPDENETTTGSGSHLNGE